MSYKINYKTGAGNEDCIETIEDAMATSDKGACYTQQDIEILGDDGSILTRKWIGCLDGLEDCDDPIQFGSFGYYADWRASA